MFSKVLLVFAIITINQTIGARKCDLKSIFLTPEEIAKRDYDQFQILERSNFGEETPQTTTTNNEPTMDGQYGGHPRSYANAQVLLRIGHEDIPRIQNINDLSTKCQYPPNFYYPPMMPMPQNPCFYNHFMPPVFPNYFYTPNLWSSSLRHNTINPEQCIYLSEEPKEEPIKSPTIYRIVEASTINGNKHEDDMKIANTLEDQYITRIERKNHPKILKPLDLSEEKIKHGSSKLNNSVNDDEKRRKTSKDIVNEKIPTIINEKSGKLLVTYPINENNNKQTCKSCQRDPNIEFGKRFPVDEDDLTSYQKAPITQSNILRNILPEIIFNILKKHLMMSENTEPKTYFSHYQTSSGSSSYADPYKIVTYQEPTRMAFVESDSNVPFEQITKIEMPSVYKIVPKYNIIPKYDIVPISDGELPGKLWNKMLQMSQTTANLGESRSYCPTCAKYYKELNE